MPYVYSTLSNDNNYHIYHEQANPVGNNPKSIDVPRVKSTILIKGGAGVANKRLDTPLGVVTHVTDEELAYLLTDEAFQAHVKNGYIKYDKKEVSIETAVSTMEARDVSAPIVPEDGLKGDVNGEDSSESDENSSKKSKKNFKVKNSIV